MSEYQCCCGCMHVERGAYMIAFIGAILAALFAIANFLMGNVVMGVVAILFFLIYWSILAAQKSHKPGLYVPFLVMNAMGAVLLALWIVFLVLMLVLLPDFWWKEGGGGYVWGGNRLLGTRESVVGNDCEEFQRFAVSPGSS